MTEPSSDPSSSIVSDPGLMVRRWVAQLLRVAVGFTVLNVGLAGYMAFQVPTVGGFGFGGGGGPFSNSPLLAPVMSTLPYVAIAVGLALVLGFLTTASSVASMLLGLMVPILFGVMMFTGAGPMGFGPRGDHIYSSLLLAGLYLPSLVPQVALIWLSPLENHPYSVDTLIFGRNELSFPRPEPAPGGTMPDDLPPSVIRGVPAVGEPAPEVGSPGDVPLVDLQG